MTVTAPVPPAWYYHKNRHQDRHQRRRHRCILQLLRPTQGRLLDYGCGYGDLTEAMSHTHTVCGVDVDADRVAFAQAEYAPLDFHVCRCDGLDFPDESFDVVTSVVVLHFVPAPAPYLAEAWRVLRPGGHLIVASQCKPRLRARVRQWLGRPAGSWPGIDPIELDRLVDAAGFVKEEEGWFFDPLFEGRKNAVDVSLGLVQQGLGVFGPRGMCDYYALRARKVACGVHA